jgi:hypothetical protein
MEFLENLAPEIIVSVVVFVVLSSMAALYNHSKIIKWIVRFMIFRALLPVIVVGILYLVMNR